MPADVNHIDNEMLLCYNLIDVLYNKSICMKYCLGIQKGIIFMKLSLKFPENLYSDVRVEEAYSLSYVIENDDVSNDSDRSESGAMIRVFDGKLWYTTSTNDLDAIQKELDSLAKLATPNPDIYNHPEVRNLEVNVDSVLLFSGDNDVRKVDHDTVKALAEEYVKDCVDRSLSEINYWEIFVGLTHNTYSFCSSKGAAIERDIQEAKLFAADGITVNGVTTYAIKAYVKQSFDELRGHKDEILENREKYLDYARNAVDVEPGDYTCVLSPVTTAMFTHESFGHKSESDFMLNDQTLRDEWIMGKKVGNDIVSICDDGTLVHHGFVPYDDEGTKAKATWLIKNGILTGRLHNAKSAATLGEELTGNARAQDYSNFPVVRMTNTYMEPGTTKVEDMIAGIEDGIYVWNVSSGGGQAMFTMRPTVCYRIRNGRICEPVRVNVINGNVFRTLFDIDAVGDDFEIFDTYTCGKNGQSAIVSAGGPTIRVKQLTVN